MNRGSLIYEPGFALPACPDGSLPAGTAGKKEKPPRAGEVCPQCKTGRLDYDGLLNLVCPGCGYALGGSFT